MDFGCGNGAQTILLPESSHVLAADIDRADLLRLQGVLRENKFRHILPLQFDGDRLPVRSQSIDMAISFEVLEHVADESTALQELYRVLKPGGQLILSVPNKWWIFETHGAYLPLLPWNRVPFFSWLPRSIHRRFAKARIYRRSEVLRLLRQHAFRCRRAMYITAPLDVIQSRRIKRFFKRTIFKHDTTRIPFLATSILVQAQKGNRMTNRSQP